MRCTRDSAAAARAGKEQASSSSLAVSATQRSQPRARGQFGALRNSLVEGRDLCVACRPGCRSARASDAHRRQGSWTATMAVPVVVKASQDARPATFLPRASAFPRLLLLCFAARAIWRALFASWSSTRLAFARRILLSVRQTSRAHEDEASVAQAEP